MKTTRLVAVSPLLAAITLAFNMALTQQVGARLIDLRRHNLSVAGSEVVQTIVDSEPGTTAPRHTHPGEEVIYVLEGTWEYTLRASRQ